MLSECRPLLELIVRLVQKGRRKKAKEKNEKEEFLHVSRGLRSQSE